MKLGLVLALTVALCTGLPAASRADSSSVSQLAAGTAQNVAKQTTGELTSWGLAQLGFPSTNGSQQLASLLQQVVAELDAIETDVADLDCIDNAADAQNAASRIQNAWTTYETAVDDGYIDSTALSEWEDYILGSGTNSMTGDIQLIVNDFTGQGSGQSILASCETAAGVAPPKDYTLDDRTAWMFSSNLIAYYADTAIVGIAMLADEYHLQAYNYWLQEGNTPADTTTDNLPNAVCGNPVPGSDRAGACAAAATNYTTYRNLVVALLDYGGAPYSTKQQLLLNGRGSLWVLSLNDLMSAGGYSSSCIMENSAGMPCGAGVGDATLSHFYQSGSTTKDISYGSYVTAWSPANTADWKDLLHNWNGAHLWKYLVGLGFDQDSVETRFFYTGEVDSGNVELTHDYLGEHAHFHQLEWACYVSTDSSYNDSESYGGQPFCYPFSKLDSSHTNGKDTDVCITYKVPQALINDSDQTSETNDALLSNFFGGQYQLAQECDSGKHARGWEDPVDSVDTGYPPGWLRSYRVDVDATNAYPAYDSGTVDSPTNAQYHWPVVNLDAYYQQQGSSCTAKSTNRDGTGVLPSLCGPLLDAYVNAYIPPQPAVFTSTPTPTGPTATPTPTATATPTGPTATLTPTPMSVGACSGDCGGDGEVTVNEVITLVNIVLGLKAPSACPYGIPSGQAVDMTTIMKAVEYSLTSCPAA